MFGSPWSLYAIRWSLFGLHTHEPTMFPMSCSHDGMNEQMCACIVLVVFGGIYVVELDEGVCIPM